MGKIEKFIMAPMGKFKKNLNYQLRFYAR